MPRILAAVSVLLCIAAIARAEVYTWTDRQGISHFSDQPPDAIPHRQIQPDAPVTLPMSENLQQGKRISGIREEVRELLAETGDSGSAKVKARDSGTCAGYRRKLENIQSRLRAGYSNDEGNRLRRQRRDLSQRISRECILR